MRLVAQLTVAVTMLTIAVLAWRITDAHLVPAAPNAPLPTILQIRQLSRLTVLQIPIVEARTARLDGYLGGLSLVLIVHGEAFFGCDLERSRIIELNAKRRHAVFSVPRPQIGRARLDHTASRVYRFDREGLWRAMPGAAGESRLIDRALRAAQSDLATTADRPEHHTQARVHTAAVIERFLAAMGWTAEVRWQPDDASD